MGAQILLFPTGHSANDHPTSPVVSTSVQLTAPRNPEDVVNECMRETLAICYKYGLVPDIDKFSANPSFTRDVAFLDDAVRALVFRYVGKEHRWHGMIDRTVKLKEGLYDEPEEEV